MNALCTFLAAGLWLGLAPWATTLGPAAGAILLVALTVLLAVASSEEVSGVTVGCGALGGLCWGIAGCVCAPVAGALAFACALVGRTTRVNGARTRALHLGLAGVAGALGAALAAGGGSAVPEARAAAILLAATLATLPLFVPADCVQARRLERAARALPGAIGERVTQAAALVRLIHALGVAPRYRRQLQPPWRALRGLIDARVRLEQWARSPLTADRAACADLDRRVEAMLTVLADAHRAVEDARATTLGMDDRALRAAEWLRDSLVDAARALSEADAVGAPILVESARPPNHAPDPGDQPGTLILPRAT